MAGLWPQDLLLPTAGLLERDKPWLRVPPSWLWHYPAPGWSRVAKAAPSSFILYES